MRLAVLVFCVGCAAVRQTPTTCHAWSIWHARAECFAPSACPPGTCCAAAPHAVAEGTPLSPGDTGVWEAVVTGLVTIVGGLVAAGVF